MQQIVDLYDMEARLSGPNGVIRQCEFFLYSGKDRDAVAQVLALGRRYPEVTSWIRANKNDLKLVKDLGLRETGILTSCSDYHIFKELGLDRNKAAAMYLEVVREAVKAGITPRCHLEDLTRADIYGVVVPFVQELMDIQRDGGVPVKVRLCDTMGWALPYPGAALPRSIAKLVHVMVHDGGVPKAQLEWHGHNDFYKTLINASTAWLYGCAGANGTLLGIGERTGNTPIEGLCVEYAMQRGTPNGMDLRVITDIAEYYRQAIKEDIPVRAPLVGGNLTPRRPAARQKAPGYREHRRLGRSPVPTGQGDRHRRGGDDRAGAAAFARIPQPGGSRTVGCHAGLTGNPPTFSRFHGERTG